MNWNDIVSPGHRIWPKNNCTVRLREAGKTMSKSNRSHRRDLISMTLQYIAARLLNASTGDIYNPCPGDADYIPSMDRYVVNGVPGFNQILQANRNDLRIGDL